MTYASVPNILRQKKTEALLPKSTQEWLPDWFIDFKFHHPVCHSGTPFDTFFARKNHTERSTFHHYQSRLLKLWGYPCILTSSAGFGRPIASEMTTWMDDWYLHLDVQFFYYLATFSRFPGKYRQNVTCLFTKSIP